MRIIRIDIKTTVAIVVLVIGLFVSYAIFAQAQGAPTGPTDQEVAELGITFPVAELGNCNSKGECKTYCDDPAHIPECIAFAEEHGLMNEGEATRAREFSSRLDRGEGPGGCRSPRDCDAYCTDVGNLEKCMAFADEHGIDDENTRDGRKILSYIRAGGEMPGGCTSEESCETYCSDVDHAEECFAFMEKSGIGPGPDEDLSIEQMRVVMDLMRRGESPGGCRSKDECEAYCDGSDHFEECIAFAEKAGFVSPEEAVMIRKTGGKGPGDCNSERSCDAFCNDPANQDECFKFAEEHGLISKEELMHIKEGSSNLRVGLEQAPPEVAECLKASLGPNIINEIQAGTLTPGPAMGDKVRGCFERFGHRGLPEEIFENAPQEVLSCMREKLGGEFDRIRSGEVPPTPQIGETIRACFDQFGPRPGEFFTDAPPEVVVCIKSRLGDDFERIKEGRTPPGPEFEAHVKACFEEFGGKQFGPHDEGDFPDGSSPDGTGPRTGPFPGLEDGPGIGAQQGFDFQSIPPAVLECVKTAVGVDVFENIKGGRGFPGPEFGETIKSCFMKVGLQQGPQPGQHQDEGDVFSKPREAPFPGFDSSNDFQSPVQTPGFTGSSLPPEVSSCVRGYVGDAAVRDLEFGSPPQDVVDAIKRCYTELQQVAPTEPQPSGGSLLETFKNVLFFLK